MIEFSGVAADRIAQRFGTPTYVYEEPMIRDAYRQLTKAYRVDELRIHYAVKANSNPWILKVLADEGAWADVVSPGEIFLAQYAGFPVERMLFNESSPTDDELRYAVEAGVRINVESLSELTRLGRIAPGIEIGVRFNVYVGGGHHHHVITGGPESKFGIDWERVDDVHGIAKAAGLRVAGVHCHIGSGVLEAQRFVDAVGNLLTVARQFDDLEFVNFGGGIGIPYRESDPPIDLTDLGSRLEQVYDQFATEYGSRPAVCLEPGRFLVAQAGTLLCRVTTVKQARKYLFIGTDTGFNHLVRPSMYGSYHRIEPVDPRDVAHVPSVINGNICESGDVFTQGDDGIEPRSLPPLAEGDLLAIRDAGAYGFSMASRYNSFALPAEVMVRDGVMASIRDRLPLETLLDGVPQEPGWSNGR